MARLSPRFAHSALQLRKPRAPVRLIRPFERDQMAILLRTAPPHLAIILRFPLDTG